MEGHLDSFLLNVKLIFCLSVAHAFLTQLTDIFMSKWAREAFFISSLKVFISKKDFYIFLFYSSLSLSLHLFTSFCMILLYFFRESMNIEQ